MKTQTEIAQLTDDTLDSINNLQQVEANTFLFSKLQHRMQYNAQQTQLARVKILSRLSVALVLFIGLNVGSYYLLLGNSPKPKTMQKSTAVQAFASEYQLNTNEYNY